MRVVVYGPLRSATGEKTVDLSFDGGTVREALAAFVEAYPRSSGQLLDDAGALRPSVRVTRNGERVEPGDECAADDELRVVPAVQGGQ